jgi:hypothetical protein
LRDPERGIHLHVLTDEPNYFPEISCITVPRSFATKSAKYKARALEYFRVLMRFTQEDWILHLDEESTIDQGSLEACINFIEPNLILGRESSCTISMSIGLGL